MSNIEMWDYWRDKYGIEYALEEYYAYMLEAHPVLKQALQNIQINQAFINQFMLELARSEEE